MKQLFWYLSLLAGWVVLFYEHIPGQMEVIKSLKKKTQAITNIIFFNGQMNSET